MLKSIVMLMIVWLGYREIKKLGDVKRYLTETKVVNAEMDESQEKANTIQNNITIQLQNKLVEKNIKK